MIETPKTKKTARLKAMDLLARRDHSEKELRDKLGNRFESAEIDLALSEIKERGWLLPAEELTRKVSESLHRKNKGYHAIQFYLKKKGLPPIFKDDELELEKAQRLVEQKTTGQSLTESHLTKVSSLLKNRGFDTETIGKVIHEIRRSSKSIY